MQVDAVTIIAQVLNFALLVFLLRRFLYRPVLDAMDRREHTIESRLSDARERMSAAEKREAEFAEKAAELEREKSDVMERAHDAARERAVTLHEELRLRIEERERQWSQNLVRTATDELESLRSELRAEILATVRGALVDLADRELETQLLTRFLEQVDELSDEQAASLRGTERPGPPMIVATTTPLPGEQREAVTQRLIQRFGSDTKFGFETDEGLVAGVELRCHGHRVGWNVDDYVDELDSSVRRRIAALDRDAPPLVMEGDDVRNAPA